VIGNMAFMLMAVISPLSRDRAARAGPRRRRRGERAGVVARRLLANPLPH